MANTTNTFCLFSLPLGAVRLTEQYIAHDPPRRKEIEELREFVRAQLKPVMRRVQREKFTMAFGSAGTITALAETDTRVTGDANKTG